MQTNLSPNPPIGTPNVKAVDGLQNVNDMIRSLATFQSGTSRPEGIKNGEFWCQDLDGNGTKFQLLRYVETTTTSGVVKNDVPFSVDLIQEIRTSENSTTDKAPSEKAIAIKFEEFNSKLENKIDKSAISSDLNVSTETNVASSKAVNDLFKLIKGENVPEYPNISGGNILKKLGSRTSDGLWTITVKPYEPFWLSFNVEQTKDTTQVVVRPISGFTTNIQVDNVYYGILLGKPSGVLPYPYTTMLIPMQTSVTVQLYHTQYLFGGEVVAYQ